MKCILIIVKFSRTLNILFCLVLLMTSLPLLASIIKYCWICVGYVNHYKSQQNNVFVYYNSTYNSALCRSDARVLPKFINQSGLHAHSLLDQGPFHFIKTIKNPCFHQEGSGIFKLFPKFRCLPYFSLIGFPKCGSTDLWDRVSKHPNIVARHFKESHFIDEKRFYGWSFDKYMDYFEQTSSDILRVCGGESYMRVPCNIITGEATVNTASVNDLWYTLPENTNCTEPRFTNADYIKHINPNTRLIAILRDPVARLWSDYTYLAKPYKYETSAAGFHSNATHAIAMYEDCLRYFTPRGCAYNNSIGSIHMRLRIGMYDIHLADWLRIFPRDQLLVIRSEDYNRNIPGVLAEVFRFLNIRQLDHDDTNSSWQAMLRYKKSNVQSHGEHMLNQTKKMLHQFYSKFNIRLSRLLNDSRFTWSDIEH